MEILASACDLNYDDVPPGNPIGAFYTNSCAPDDLRLAGTTGRIDGVQPGQLVDTLTGGSGLRLYQLDCSCAQAIQLVADPGPPKVVRIEF